MRPSAVLFALPLLAAPPAIAGELAATTGLWEMTSTVHMQGQFLSPETLARIPPQARAQIEASMQSIQQPHSHQTCLTAEKLRRGFRFDEHRHGECQQQVVNETSTVMEMSAVCHEGGADANMHAKFTLAGPQHMVGTFDMDRNGAEGPQHITGQITGKWLAADCGSVGKDEP
ncbi:MAG: DUF3617 domain-containing protein [Rhodospirillales bacterium]